MERFILTYQGKVYVSWGRWSTDRSLAKRFDSAEEAKTFRCAWALFEADVKEAKS